MSLLKHPSSAMSKLITSVDKGGAENDGDRALQRPVMSFIVQRHDLDGLQLAMRQSLRKSACRVFAMQVNRFADKYS
jgi:E3 ubiquitin-protein ligase MYCBP2